MSSGLHSSPGDGCEKRGSCMKWWLVGHGFVPSMVPRPTLVKGDDFGATCRLMGGTTRSSCRLPTVRGRMQQVVTTKCSQAQPKRQVLNNDTQLCLPK